MSARSGRSPPVRGPSGSSSSYRVVDPRSAGLGAITMGKPSEPARLTRGFIPARAGCWSVVIRVSARCLCSVCSVGFSYVDPGAGAQFRGGVNPHPKIARIVLVKRTWGPQTGLEAALGSQSSLRNAGLGPRRGRSLCRSWCLSGAVPRRCESTPENRLNCSCKANLGTPNRPRGRFGVPKLASKCRSFWRGGSPASEG